MANDDKQSELETVPPPAGGDAYGAMTVVRAATSDLLELIAKMGADAAAEAAAGRPADVSTGAGAPSGGALRPPALPDVADPAPPAQQRSSPADVVSSPRPNSAPRLPVPRPRAQPAENAGRYGFTAASVATPSPSAAPSPSAPSPSPANPESFRAAMAAPPAIDRAPSASPPWVAPAPAAPLPAPAPALVPPVAVPVPVLVAVPEAPLAAAPPPTKRGGPRALRLWATAVLVVLAMIGFAIFFVLTRRH